MRILHVAETVKGGIASYLDELIPDQVRTFGADNIRVLVPDRQKSELANVSPGQVLTFRSTRLHRVVHLATLALSFRHALHEFRPHVVHLHSSIAGISCRFVWRPADVKLVYCAHGWGFARRKSQLSNAFVGLLERVLSHRSNAIICLSKLDFDLAIRQGIHAAKLHVIPNGISSARPPAKDDDDLRWHEHKIRVLFVGRFDFQKGFDTFAEALRHLANSHQAIAIGMPVVDGSLPEDLPPNIHTIGWQPRALVHRYMASADVVVMPSRWEGAPITVLEAMREGTAVIGTRVGAIPEQITDRRNGILIDPDNPTQLAVELALHQAKDFCAMGAAGHERFHQLFDGNRMIAATQRLYAKIADAQPMRAPWAEEMAAPSMRGTGDGA